MFKLSSLLIGLAFFFSSYDNFGQVNYVSNPSFEDVYNCNPPYIIPLSKGWNCLDSSKPNLAGFNYNMCFGNLPLNGATYQFPRTGNDYIRLQAYCTTVTCSSNLSRGYPKNRLKNLLINSSTYCVSMYVNLTNTSPYSIDALQVLLADITIDTITNVNAPLTYLTPQITNTLGIITDTLNWIKIENTFVATGTEKYLVIGNFKTDAATSASNTGVSSGVWSEYMVDDVSVIDFNLPAFAGPDKNIALGDSAFIGRPPEVGLECIWATGATTIGSGGGIWVKPPLGTYSYVVTQNICGNIKTDTVNVNVSPSSINENTFFANSIGIYPNPAKDIITISLSNYYEPSIEIKISDVNGRLVTSEKLIVNSGKTQVSTSELSNGVYILQISNSKNQVVQKRLVVAK